MKIAIGADHAGFSLKQKIVKYLSKTKINFKDFGAFSAESCDYTDYAFPVAKAVAKKKYDRGILICGSGVGMSIAANRIKGIRAVNPTNLYMARQSRQHGDSNILCLGSKTLSWQKAKRVIEVWLSTSFSGEERHARRIKAIDKGNSHIVKL